MVTLKKSWEFDRVRREGRTWSSGLVVLNAAPSSAQSGVRCGFIVGKKVGGAVERNRARRLMKEAVRARLGSIKLGWDLVWIGRSGIDKAKFDEVLLDVETLLKRSRLLAQPPEVAETTPTL